MPSRPAPGRAGPGLRPGVGRPEEDAWHRLDAVGRISAGGTCCATRRDEAHPSGHQP